MTKFHARVWREIAVNAGKTAAQVIMRLHPLASNDFLNAVLEHAGESMCRQMLDAGVPSLTIQRCLDAMADASRLG